MVLNELMEKVAQAADLMQEIAAALPEAHPLISDAETIEHMLATLHDRMDMANLTYVKQIPVWPADRLDELEG